MKGRARIVFFGDSITKAGIRPEGYVTLVRRRLPDLYPEEKIEIVASGVSGDDVPDLQARLDRDVLRRKPTHVVIYVGVNDVGQRRTSSRVSDEDRRVYREGLFDLVSRTQLSGARVVLCTPAVFGDDPSSATNENQLMEEYAAMSRHVAAETGATLCDLRAVFREYLRTNNSARRYQGVVTIDGVHLNDQGNRLVADHILQILDVGSGESGGLESR